MRKCFEKGEVFCFKCKTKLIRPSEQIQNGRNVASVDHIIPIDKNPAFARDPRNFRIACQSCNSSRR
jgi:5-methylcytosine-specific restriction endonuclease McrA